MSSLLPMMIGILPSWILTQMSKIWMIYQLLDFNATYVLMNLAITVGVIPVFMIFRFISIPFRLVLVMILILKRISIIVSITSMTTSDMRMIQAVKTRNSTFIVLIESQKLPLLYDPTLPTYPKIFVLPLSRPQHNGGDMFLIKHTGNLTSRIPCCQCPSSDRARRN